MTSTTSPLLIGGLGGMEMIIILAVLVLLFGASKLPDLARGSGQALRIFKAETKGLMDDDEPEGTKKDRTAEGATAVEASPVAAPVAAEPIISEPAAARDDVTRG